MTLPYAEVIGDPIAHSKSPLIHGFWLEKLGIEAEYRKTHVKRDEVSAFLANRRCDADWRGCNVTVPHKEAVIPLLDRLDPLAERIGAVNTVVAHTDTLLGYNTDAAGFLEPIASVPMEGRRAAILGAGGAARAALVSLSGCRLGSIAILARRPAQAQALLDSLGIAGETAPLESSSLAGANIVVNASPLGMTGFPPLDIDLHAIVRERPVLYDMVYAPLETALLREARQLDFTAPMIVDGLQMLVGQAAAAFALFFGQPAPRAYDTELRALLTA